MAAKTEEVKKTLERTYNVPLRKEYQKAPIWKRTEKAVVAMKQFLARHMKSDDVRVGNDINRKIWQHGIRNPPHHVKITATKDEKGVVRAELFGSVKEAKAPKKKTAKTEAVAAPQQ